MRDEHWPRLFFVAGLFNFAVGLPLTLMPVPLLAMVGQPAPNDLMFVRLAGLLVSTYGIGYVMISRAPAANRNLVWLGAIGKLGAVTVFTIYWLGGLLSTTAAALGSGDLFFALLFLRYLQTGDRAAVRA